MRRRTIGGLGSAGTVVLVAVTGALINELHGGWAWWIATGGVVLLTAIVTFWLATRSEADPRDIDRSNEDVAAARRYKGSVRRRWWTRVRQSSAGRLAVVGVLIAAVGVAVTIQIMSGPDQPRAQPLSATPQGTGNCPIPADAPLAVVGGGRAGSPAPSRSPILEQIVAAADGDAIGDTPPLMLVDVGERPTIHTSREFRSTSNNDQLIAGERTRFRGEFMDTYVRMRAKTPEVNVLGALDIAARAVRSNGQHGTVAVFDSGLATSGSINFNVAGTLDAPASDIVEYLRQRASLPDFTGVTVVLTGIGDTAAPQQPLGQPLRLHLIDLWSRIAQGGNAECVSVNSKPQTGDAPPDVLPVKQVAVPAPPTFDPSKPNLTILRDDDLTGVHFEADTAKFRDPDVVQRVLQPIAAWLKADRSRRVTVTGTSARIGPESGQLMLSEARAKATKDLLVTLGADPGQVIAFGVGSKFSEYVPDRGPQGELLPGPAQVNRSVRIVPN